MNDSKAKVYPWTWGKTFPASFSLRQYAPLPRGQNTGDCEEFAAWGAVECGRRVFDLQCPPLSVFYMPFKAGQTSLDNPGVWQLPSHLVGAIYRDIGICREDLHNGRYYAPSAAADEDAATRKGLENYSLKKPWTWAIDPENFREPLLNGLPILCTFPIWESFASVGRDGRVHMPNTINERCLGGHAVYFLGYDDNEQRLLGQNNWGGNWADYGFFTLPYAYIKQYMGGPDSPWCFSSTTQTPAVPMPPPTNASILAALKTLIDSLRHDMPITQTLIDQLRTLVNGLVADLPSAPPSSSNVAAGCPVSGSSSYNAAFPMIGITNGERTGRDWARGGGWNSIGALPQWIEIQLRSVQPITSVTIYTVQDNYTSPSEPTDQMTFTRYGVQDFIVEAGTERFVVTGNNLVKRKVTFAAPVMADRVRVTVTRTPDDYARIVEVEAT